MREVTIHMYEYSDGGIYYDVHLTSPDKCLGAISEDGGLCTGGNWTEATKMAADSVEVCKKRGLLEDVEPKEEESQQN